MTVRPQEYFPLEYFSPLNLRLCVRPLVVHFYFCLYSHDEGTRCLTVSTGRLVVCDPLSTPRLRKSDGTLPWLGRSWN